MEKDLLIYGTGGAGRELAFSLSLEEDAAKAWNVSGFVVDDESLWGETINGVEVRGGFDWLVENGGNVAICAVADPYKKQGLVERLKKAPSVVFPLVIAPRSSISRYIEWGEGCLVALSYNFITVNIKIGDFVFINCGNGIGHDVEIGDFTTVYSHIDISGAVKIGSHCIIGSGATINPGVTIGNGTIIGSGSVVVGDIPDNVIAAGVPAKVIKERAGS